MKKTAIALAVSAAVAVPAFADNHSGDNIVTNAINTLTISGNVKYLLEDTDKAGDEFGLNSNEDTDLDILISAELGGGWSGALEFDLEDTDNPGPDVNSITLSHNDFGSLQVGGDVYNGNTGRLSNSRDSDLALNIRDGISYTTPNLGGFSVGVTIEMNDDAATAGVITNDESVQIARNTLLNLLSNGASSTDPTVVAARAALTAAETAATNAATASATGDGDRALGFGISYGTEGDMGAIDLALGYAGGKGSDFDEDDQNIFTVTDSSALATNPVLATRDASLLSVGLGYAIDRFGLNLHYEAVRIDVPANVSNQDYSGVSIAASYDVTDATELGAEILVNDFVGPSKGTGAGNLDNDNTDIGVSVGHTIGNFLLTGKYALTIYDLNGLEDQSELDLSAIYNFTNSWSTGIELEFKTNTNGAKDSDLTTTKFFVAGAF